MGRLVGLLLLAMFLALGLTRLIGEPDAERTPEQHDDPVATEHQILEQDIAFFRARAERDPSGWLDLTQLGMRVMRRARQTGQPGDYAEAERVANIAIGHRPKYPAAWQLLVSSLMSQHRFAEALGAADSLVAASSRVGPAPAIRAEVLLELGRYLEADRIFRSLWFRRFEPGIAVRTARWLEVRGRLAEARDLLSEARTRSVRSELPSDQRAWFDLRLGELALKAGAFREAARWFDRGLEEAPDDGRLLAAMARLQLDRGDPRGAIVWGDSALAVRPDAPTLGVLAEALNRIGDASKARDFQSAIDATGGLELPGFDRRYALFLLDSGERVPEVLRAAERELETRRDFGTLDLVAWARFRSGETGAARAAIEEALGWNPTDLTLLGHRAAIRAAIARDGDR